MKKINKFIFLIFFLLSFKTSSNEIKNFEAIVEEKNEKIIKYKLKVCFPSRLYKEVISPLNKKGEIYIYNNKDKTIFYPSINYILKEKVDEEDILLKALKDIKEFMKIKTSKNKLRRRNIILQFKDKRLYLIKYPDNTKIFLKNYVLKESIYFPEEIEVVSRNEKIAISIEEIKFNINFEDKDFEVSE